MARTVFVGLLNFGGLGPEVIVVGFSEVLGRVNPRPREAAMVVVVARLAFGLGANAEDSNAVFYGDFGDLRRTSLPWGGLDALRRAWIGWAHGAQASARGAPAGCRQTPRPRAKALMGLAAPCI